MALNAKRASGGGGKRAPALEAGTYPARVVQVIDLGLQEQAPFQGQEKDPVDKIFVTYELLDEFLVDEDGKEQEDRPRWLSEEFPLFNLRSERAKSTKRYTALDPELEHDGDWSELLGAPCMVTVTTREKNGTTYNNVGSLSGMRAKDVEKARELVNPPKMFDTSDPDMEVFFSLPDWLQDKIKGNLNYEGSPLEKLVEQGPSESGKAEKKKAAEKKEEPESSDEEDSDDEDW